MGYAGTAKASYKKKGWRKKQAAQHICFRISERKNNEDEPKKKLFLLS